MAKRLVLTILTTSAPVAVPWQLAELSGIGSNTLAQEIPMGCPEFDIHTGMDLIDTVRMAPKIGIKIEDVRGTGELRLSDPLQPSTIRVNGRRKDTPPAVVCYLKRAARARGLAR